MKVFLREAISIDFNDLGDYISTVAFQTISNARIPFDRDTLTLDESKKIAKDLIRQFSSPSEAFKSKTMWNLLLKYLEKAHQDLSEKAMNRMIARRIEGSEELEGFVEILKGRGSVDAVDVDGLIRMSPIRKMNINLAKVLMGYYLNREGYFSDSKWYPFIKKILADLIQRALVFSKRKAPWPEDSGRDGPDEPEDSDAIGTDFSEPLEFKI